MRRVPLFSVGFASTVFLTSKATFAIIGPASDTGITIPNGVLVDNRWLAAAG